MSAPFYMVQLKIFPFSEEVYYGGTTYSDPHALWNALQRDANAYVPGGKGSQLGDRAPKEQVFRNSPEVEAWLASGGKITRPAPKPKASGRINLDDLDDLILSDLKIPK